MTRDEKIEALLDQLIPKWIVTVHRDIFRDCVLAGLKLRDEELLAMEFDIHKYNNYCLKFFNQSTNENWPTRLESAMWQHEQFMKAIKGDG